MSADDAPAEKNEPQALQFDRVETTAPSDVAAAPGVTCTVCGKSVGNEYYTANGKPICESCRHVVTQAAATPRSAGPLIKAGIFGLGAAIAGAAIYYAVIAIANLEIGIVAILIGYMVGYMVRKGAGGRGGRRFQILAVILTYWAVGLAYSPLAFKELTKDKKGTSASSDSKSALADSASTTTATPDTASKSNGTAKSTPESAVSGREALTAIGALVLLVFALPALSVFGSLPLGLISALIIFIGMRQAWNMTAAHQLQMAGPFKVGGGQMRTPR